MSGQWAIDIVAAEILSGLADSDLVGEMWECYPEIGESDWERVTEAVQRMAPTIDSATYRQAYNFLEARADKEVS